jgi:hypothetical protein
MNAFEAGRSVEARGLLVLIPFLQERAHDGRFVLTSKGRLARHLQETVGDALFNSTAESVWTVEIKVETSSNTGNLFLETWSNRNLEQMDSHAARGSNPGWLPKIQADLLFYYFLDSDELYIIDLFRLKQWAYRHDNGHPRIEKYPERRQAKYVQGNDTWGRCVPISDLQRALGPRMKKAFPKQLELLGDYDPADDSRRSTELAWAEMRKKIEAGK